jgi:hypothetical protein
MCASAAQLSISPHGLTSVHLSEQPTGRWALEIIGEYDPSTDSFACRAYANEGGVTLMRDRVDDQGVWRFTGGGHAHTPRARTVTIGTNGSSPVHPEA